VLLLCQEYYPSGLLRGWNSMFKTEVKEILVVSVLCCYLTDNSIEMRLFFITRLLVDLTHQGSYSLPYAVSWGHCSG
jgi:hypothetical protein